MRYNPKIVVHFIDDYPGHEITIQGEKHLYFGSTSYLGLQFDAKFQNIFIKNIKKFDVFLKEY